MRILKHSITPLAAVVAASLGSSEEETVGVLRACLFRCGWRAGRSLVEVYRLPRVGIEQADRF